MLKRNSKILVTGGTGLLGAHVIRALIAEGFTNVTTTFRNKSNLNLIQDLTDQLNLEEVDILDVSSLSDVIKGTDVIIHCAALISMLPSDRDLMMKTNVEGTANVVNLALHYNIKKLVHISSVAALGRTGKPDLLDENSKWVNSKYVTNYARSKYNAELEVWRAYQEGLPVVILNPSHILGAGQWNKGSGKLFKRVSKGMTYYPPGIGGYVDVRDVASQVLIAMQSEISGERYISNAVNISYKNLFIKIADQLKVKSPSKQLPSFLAGIAWRFFRIRSFIDGSKPIVTRENIKSTFANFSYSNTKFKEEFNFKYREFDKTIAFICSIYQEDFDIGKPTKND